MRGVVLVCQELLSTNWTFLGRIIQLGVSVRLSMLLELGFGAVRLSAQVAGQRLLILTAIQVVLVGRVKLEGHATLVAHEGLGGVDVGVLHVAFPGCQGNEALVARLTG